MVALAKSGISVTVILALSLGCGVLRKPLSDIDPEYELTIVDDPSNRQFRLALESLRGESFCIAAEDWPNSIGKVGSATAAIVLRWDGGTRESVEEWCELCPGGCFVRVPSQGALEGSVRYDTFGDPEWVLSLADRGLEMRVTPVRCPRSWDPRR